MATTAVKDTHTAATAECEKPKVKSHTLGIRDVLKREEYYSAINLQDLLGISVETFNAAWNATGPGGENCRYFTQGYSDGSRRGSALLAWIEDNDIPYSISDEAAAIYERQHRKPEPPPAPPRTVDDDIDDVAETWTRSEAEDVADYAERLRCSYLKHLTASELSVDDLREMSQVCEELGINKVQRCTDRELIARAKDLLGKHHQRKEATQARAQAYQAYKDLEARHKREEREAWCARGTAEHFAGKCNEAAYQLGRLKQQRPILFQKLNGSDNLPLLVSQG